MVEIASERTVTVKNQELCPNGQSRNLIVDQHRRLEVTIGNHLGDMAQVHSDLIPRFGATDDEGEDAKLLKVCPQQAFTCYQV
jgi:hypothetical protein